MSLDPGNLEVQEGEYILSRDNGWDRASWDRLLEEGVMPLRHISQEEILVWGGGFPSWVGEPLLAPDAEWRGSEEVKDVRVLLEPRLPYDVRQEVIARLGDVIIGTHVDGLPQSITVNGVNEEFVKFVLEIPGVLWVEPVLSTSARNSISASTMQGGEGHPLWNSGFNGTGVIIAVADTGIDLDHSCFRENLTSIGEVGIGHRKVVLHNTTIDDWDNSGQADFRHGTHVAGTLACNPITNGSQSIVSISHGAKLIVQDLVGSEGWQVPPVTELLHESTSSGAIINSYSWGDDTTEYTARSGNLDAWTSEVPFSVVFVAPGNDGSTIMEPANARNVIAVGASSRNGSEFYPWSSHGKTPWGTRGITLVAPGVSVNSAMADGVVDSLNSGTRASSGTSMATPMAAGAGAIIQQMVSSGHLAGSNQTYNSTPSGPLLRALLALASTPMEDAVLKGERASLHPDHLQGFGLINLTLLDEETWIHDSYKMVNWQGWYELRSESGLPGMVANPWNGSGANGPFLKSGESAKFQLIRAEGEDLVVRMAFPARAQPAPVDDLQLVVRGDNGLLAVGGLWEENGTSRMIESGGLDALNASNETVVGLKIPASSLLGLDRVEIEVRARHVFVGNSSNSLGIDGDSIGFSLAANGVVKDPWQWSDDDLDGVLNEDDSCLEENSSGFDIDKNGCIDDVDNDGVKDNVDSCLDSKPWHPILPNGCPEQNLPPVIIAEGPSVGENITDGFWINWTVEDIDPVTVSISLKGQIPQENLAPFDLEVDGLHCSKNASGSCYFSIPNIMGPTVFNSPFWNWTIIAVDKNLSNWTSNEESVVWGEGNFTIWWEEKVQSPELVSGINRSFVVIGFVGIIVGIMLPLLLINRRKEAVDWPPPAYTGAQDDSSVESLSHSRSPKAEGVEDE